MSAAPSYPFAIKRVELQRRQARSAEIQGLTDIYRRPIGDIRQEGPGAAELAVAHWSGQPMSPNECSESGETALAWALRDRQARSVN
jgi:hypothetical protein